MSVISKCSPTGGSVYGFPNPQCDAAGNVTGMSINWVDGNGNPYLGDPALLVECCGCSSPEPGCGLVADDDDVWSIAEGDPFQVAWARCDTPDVGGAYVYCDANGFPRTNPPSRCAILHATAGFGNVNGPALDAMVGTDILTLQAGPLVNPDPGARMQVDCEVRGGNWLMYSDFDDEQDWRLGMSVTGGDGASPWRSPNLRWDQTQCDGCGTQRANIRFAPMYEQQFAVTACGANYPQVTLTMNFNPAVYTPGGGNTLGGAFHDIAISGITCV